MTRNETINLLEKILDQLTLSGLLTILSEICSLKEQHVEGNWQDHELGKKWRKAELALDKLAINVGV